MKRDSSNFDGHDPDHEPGRDPDQEATALPADLADVGRLLDMQGASQRGGLSREALERISAMSDLQLPLVQSDGPLVIARIGRADASATRYWRIAAAIALIVGIGGAVLIFARGSNDPDQKMGTGATLADGSRAPVIDPVPVIAPKLVASASSTVSGRRGVSVEHLERALAGASSAREASLQFPDIDAALAADIAPLFHASSLLDGGGTTYEDLSGEFAAIVAPTSCH
jgi:hypothetical protein